MGKKIVIIGAGIAGLSAGCYARMNGYDAEIYESHSLPGDYCMTAAKTSRDIIQIICKADRKKLTVKEYLITE